MLIAIKQSDIQFFAEFLPPNVISYCAPLKLLCNSSSTEANACADETVASPSELTNSGNLSKLSFIDVYISK